MIPVTVLLATTNRGKLREVQVVLSGLSVEFTTLDDHRSLPEPVEDAGTFEGNAVLKAQHYSRLVDGWVLADDSGLEVDALDGAPGVHSARYAGLPPNDLANNSKLIKALAAVPSERRTAKFRCVLALAERGTVLSTTSGTVEGTIVDEARGENGFGYDPHFFVPPHGITTAQMAPEQKNRISHRGKALRAMRECLERRLAE